MRLVLVICFAAYFIVPLIPIISVFENSANGGHLSPFDSRDIIVATVWGLTTGIFAWCFELLIREKSVKKEHEEHFLLCLSVVGCFALIATISLINCLGGD